MITIWIYSNNTNENIRENTPHLGGSDNWVSNFCKHIMKEIRLVKATVNQKDEWRVYLNGVVVGRFETELLAREYMETL